jgi:hypothetical protein
MTAAASMMQSAASGGTRQERAAELRAQLEAARKQAEQKAQSLGESAEDQSESGGPVGTGDYEVKFGECCSSIARKTGHFWKTIWNHPDNSAVAEIRKLPNVLMQGDRITIPEIERKYETCAAEQRHRFVRKGEPSWFRVTLLKYDEPRANEPYTFDCDGAQRPGMTDIEGKVDEAIPGTARVCKLIFNDDDEEDREVLIFNLGGLSPITEISGVQSRLEHLGFDAGPSDGQLGPRTEAALRLFQAKNGLTVSGTPDADTRAKLQERHGS